MSEQHEYTFSCGDNSDTKTQTVTVEGEAAERYEVPIAADAADYEVNCNIPNDELKGLYILADQDLTLEFNDGAGTNGSIDLTANVPLMWFEGAPWALKDAITYAADTPVDITAFFVTNDSSPATATTLHIRVLRDATP